MGCTSSTPAAVVTTSPPPSSTVVNTSPVVLQLHQLQTEFWSCPICYRANVNSIRCAGCSFSLAGDDTPPPLTSTSSSSAEPPPPRNVLSRAAKNNRRVFLKKKTAAGTSKNIALEKSYESITSLADRVVPAQYWTCRNCTYDNAASRTEFIPANCDVCNTERKEEDVTQVRPKSETFADSDAWSKAEAKAIDSAISSVECPICLEVYRSPVTLHCGHTLCFEHIMDVGRKCPVCRKEFDPSVVKKKRSCGDGNRDEDEELAGNVESIVRMISTMDPSRDTIKSASERLNIVVDAQ